MKSKNPTLYNFSNIQEFKTWLNSSNPASHRTTVLERNIRNFPETQQVLADFPLMTIKDIAYHVATGEPYQYHYCKTCGKQLHVTKSINLGYGVYCCFKCSGKDSTKHQKAAATGLQTLYKQANVHNFIQLKNWIKRSLPETYGRMDLVEMIFKNLSFVDQVKQKFPEMTNQEIMWHIVNNVKFQYHYCKTCGKMVHMKGKIGDGYSIYCSKECMFSDEELLQRRAELCDYSAAALHTKQTCLKKYGVENYFKTDVFKQQSKQTSLERYGVENPMQSDKVKNKLLSVFEEKYGGKSPMCSEEVRQKSIATIKDKYGEEYTNIHQVPEIKEKIKQTCLEKNGVENPAQTEEVQQRMKQTLLERYGVEHPMKSEEIKERVYKVFIEKYGVKHVLQNPEIYKKFKQTSLERYGVEHPMKCEEIMKRCFDNIKNLSDFGGHSKPELELYDYIKSLYPDAINGDRKIIFPKELDIVIPSKKIAIEFNGVYFHKATKDNQFYHLSKSILAAENGYQLIHVFEDEWKAQKTYIKDKLVKLIEGVHYFKNAKELKLPVRLFGYMFSIPGYKFVDYIEPVIMKNDCWDCGKLIFIRE